MGLEPASHTSEVLAEDVVRPIQTVAKVVMEKAGK
jgi:hypothetical protein